MISWPESADEPAPRRDLDPDERAEVIFTSGTKGDPKGVVLTHKNLISDLAPIENQYRIWEPYVGAMGSFRFPSTLPFSHMFGQAVNIFLPLFMGLTIVLTPPRPWEIVDAARRRRLGVSSQSQGCSICLDRNWKEDCGDRLNPEAFEALQKRVERWPFLFRR